MLSLKHALTQSLVNGFRRDDTSGVLAMPGLCSSRRERPESNRLRVWSSNHYLTSPLTVYLIFFFTSFHGCMSYHFFFPPCILWLHIQPLFFSFVVSRAALVLFSPSHRLIFTACRRLCWRCGLLIFDSLLRQLFYYFTFAAGVRQYLGCAEWTNKLTSNEQLFLKYYCRLARTCQL